MSSAVTTLITLVIVGAIGYYVWTNKDSILGMVKSGGDGMAVGGKMIYKGTGKVITGDSAFVDAKNPYPMHSGAQRPSARFIFGGGKGKQCVPFHSLEATVYTTIGAPSGKPPTTCFALQTGGPGQSGNNCCTYNLGFDASGKAIAEEEGAHSPAPTSVPMSVSPGMNIGPLHNRTIGLKTIIYHPSANQVVVEGWVDAQNNGSWKLFYKSTNPHGGALPIITHSPMAGSPCQEARLRIDAHWPIEFDKARSFVAEIPDNPSPMIGVTNPITTVKPLTPAQKQLVGATSTTPKGKTKTKKSNYAFEYDGQFHYPEFSPISYLYNPY